MYVNQIDTSPTSLALYGISLVVAACFLKPILDYIRDPLDLRRFTAPNILAATTPLWLMWETWNERRASSIHKQHQKLGNIIRVSPNQVLFNDPRAITEIYGHLQARKFEKDTFYDKVAAGSYHDIVTVRDHGDHSRKRRYMANSFALKTVVDMEPVIRENFQNLLNRINMVVDNEKNEKGFSQPFNIRLWFNYFTLDVIGDMAFGLPLGFLLQGNAKKGAQTAQGEEYEVQNTIDTLHTGVRYTLTLAQLLSLSTMEFWKRVTSCTSIVAKTTGSKSASDFTNIAINQLRKRLEAGIPERTSKDFVSNILTDRTGSQRDLPFMELVAESIVLLNAGSDTTAAALTNTLYYLISSPECLKKLRNEIESTISPENPEEILPYDMVCSLPYLRACIDESLRLRPPIAYPLQRIVSSPEGATVLGHHLRQGTVVAVPPYSVHRTASVFPDPEKYNPNRWLNKEDPDQIHALKNFTIPFSTGPRACLGRHIAIVELQILISSIVRKYDLEFKSPNQKLIMFERFQSNPGPLPIRFKRRSLT